MDSIKAEYRIYYVRKLESQSEHFEECNTKDKCYCWPNGDKCFGCYMAYVEDHFWTIDLFKDKGWKIKYLDNDQDIQENIITELETAKLVFEDTKYNLVVQSLRKHFKLDRVKP